jgi:hypothetical protein
MNRRMSIPSPGHAFAGQSPIVHLSARARKFMDGHQVVEQMYSRQNGS